MAAERSRRRSVLDAPLPRGRGEVSLSAFAFLFSEMVQYCQARVDVTQELEQRLSDLGYGVGLRALDLLSLREKQMRKERSVKLALQFVRSTVWRALFGKQADRLERSTASADEFYIYDDAPLTNRFVSVPRDFGQLNCASFMGGVIAGALEGADFPATVTAHEHELPSAGGDGAGGPGSGDDDDELGGDDAPRTTTVFIIKFEPEVVERERDLQAAS